jgi:hypothetical protein
MLEEHPEMQKRSTLRFTAGFLVALLAAAFTVAPAVAQTATSDWVAISDGPWSLDAGRLATDEAGSVVLVGYRGSTAPTKGKKPLDVTSGAWFSLDGATWNEASLGGGDGSAVRSVSAGPAGYVAVGVDKAGGRIWHSPTGEAWTEVSNGAAPNSTIYAVAAGPAGYVAVGEMTTGKGKKQRQIPTAWTSTDGTAWTSAPMADVPGIGVSVAASPDGGVLAGVYQGERAGPVKKGTFQTLPPSISFFSSPDGATWTPTGATPVDASQAHSWDLIYAAGQYRFIIHRDPQAKQDTSGSWPTPDGHFESPDGAVWTPVPELRGLTGAVGSMGDGLFELGDAALMVSPDGTTWQSSEEEVLADSRTRSVVSLADGRIIAAGGAPAGTDGGYTLYTGMAPTEGVVLRSDCIDAEVAAQVVDLTDGIFTLPASARERIAAALAAYVPSGSNGFDPEEIVTALRHGESLDSSYFFGLLSGQVTIPACD